MDQFFLLQEILMCIQAHSDSLKSSRMFESCKCVFLILTWSLCFILYYSMFSQQSPPHFGQQANTSMYNNNMNINVSMVANSGGLSNMNQMTGQISMTSAASVPTSGLPSMGPEQVRISAWHT